MPENFEQMDFPDAGSKDEKDKIAAALKDLAEACFKEIALLTQRVQFLEKKLGFKYVGPKNHAPKSTLIS